jgi:hypothetical protein
MVVDVFTFNGEYDLLEIRLNILNEYVDQFIIVEAPTTFSGWPKPLYYEKEKERFSKWHHKIKYHIISEDYTFDETRQAEESPNTKGASHWKHEFLQKESIKKALIQLDDNDIVYIGDVDEIWQPPLYETLTSVTEPYKLRLRVYSYYLNNRSSENFHGTIVSPWGVIKDKCLNHVRSTEHIKSPDYWGWHFTSMGGPAAVRQKLMDSYTPESYWTPQVAANLEKNVTESKDFLGRPFTYHIDESEWPGYLKTNKQKWIHLCR